MLKVDIQKKLWSAEGSTLLNLAFSVDKNKSFAIYGPSGVGKTSILRMLAGLMVPDTGIISLEENEWFNSQNKINRSPQERNIGYLFQSYALFPNMSVLNNIKYAQTKDQDLDIIEELISIMELGALVQLKPNQLSGGQQQRVALARAIIRRPKLLLLDEPLSAVDYETSLKLKSYLNSLRNRYPFTLIVVSHNPADIIALTEKVICLEGGKIIESGAPSPIFERKYGAKLGRLEP